MRDYRAIARREALRQGLDPNIFVRQIGAESGFDPNARSPAGATGIAQIMPGTARAWGVNPNDPVASLRAAAKNMAGYVRRYGSYENALRAYNAGPGAIAASRGYAETNNYVAKILQGRDPGRLGRPASDGGGQRSPARPQRASTPAPAQSGGQQLAQMVLALNAEQPQQPRPSMGLQAPAFSASAPGPRGALTLQSGAPPREDPQNGLAAALAAIEGVGQSGAAEPPEGAREGVRTPVAVRDGASGRTKRGAVRPGGGFMGSQGVIDSLRRLGGGGLSITSAKRDNTNPYSGSRSDHDNGNRDAYANDLSNGSAPTREMDRAAYRIMRELGFNDYKMGQPIDTSSGVKTITTPRGKFRVQVIYRGAGAAFGGDHSAHIHVGVKRVR